MSVNKKNTYLITRIVACVDVQRDGVHADTDESKGEKKELTDLRVLLTGASGGRGVQMCCMRMPMSAKKKEKKEKNLLEMGARRREHVVCGWRCVRMELHADGITCGWVVWGCGWW